MSLSLSSCADKSNRNGKRRISGKISHHLMLRGPLMQAVLFLVGLPLSLVLEKLHLMPTNHLDGSEALQLAIHQATCSWEKKLIVIATSYSGRGAEQ